MATVSPIQSHNATRLLFVYKSDVIGVKVYLSFGKVLKVQTIFWTLNICLVFNFPFSIINKFIFQYLKQEIPRKTIIWIDKIISVLSQSQSSPMVPLQVSVIILFSSTLSHAPSDFTE